MNHEDFFFGPSQARGGKRRKEKNVGKKKESMRAASLLNANVHPTLQESTYGACTREAQSK